MSEPLTPEDSARIEAEERLRAAVRGKIRREKWTNGLLIAVIPFLFLIILLIPGRREPERIVTLENDSSDFAMCATDTEAMATLMRFIAGSASREDLRPLESSNRVLRISNGTQARVIKETEYFSRLRLVFGGMQVICANSIIRY